MRMRKGMGRQGDGGGARIRMRARAPRVPMEAEMEELLKHALDVIPVERLWVNPDCGLKTRGWPEVEDALARMVSVAKRWRGKWNHEGLLRSGDRPTASLE